MNGPLIPTLEELMEEHRLPSLYELAADLEHQIACYTRLSKDRNGTSESPATQLAGSRQYIGGYPWNREIAAADVFTDRDKSASDPTIFRPDFHRLLDALRAGHYRVVVCFKLDRMFRQPIEYEEYVRLTKALGIVTIAVHGTTLEPWNPQAVAMARNEISFAEMESENIKIRSRPVRIKAATEGKYHGGTRAFGWAADGMTPVAKEQRFIKEAVRRTLHEGHGLRTICTDWYKRGVTTSQGNPWRTITLRTMLTSARIAGYRTHRGQIVGKAQWAFRKRNGEMVWEPLISWEEHEALVARLDQNRRRYRTSSKRYLLSGLIYCSTCDHKMSAHPNENKRRYACKRQPQSPKNCGGRVVVAPDLEAFVATLVQERLRRGKLRPSLFKATEASPDMTAQQELGSAHDRLVELQELVDAGEISPRGFAGAEKLLMERITRLEAELSYEAPLDIGQLRAVEIDLERGWDNLDFERQSEVVRILIEKVIIAPAIPGYPKFDHRRISIKWRA